MYEHLRILTHDWQQCHLINAFGDLRLVQESTTIATTSALLVCCLFRDFPLFTIFLGHTKHAKQEKEV